MKLPAKIRFDSVVAERVRERRHAAKLSLEDMSQASKGRVSKGVLVNIEQGLGCSSFVLAVCAEVLDCSLDDLAPVDAMLMVRSEAS